MIAPCKLGISLFIVLISLLYLLILDHTVTNEDIQVIGDMSEDVSLVYFLPRRTGPGVCALALSDYLCLRHNWLLDFCLHKKFTG